MRIKALVHIEPAMARANIDSRPVLGQIKLREIAEKDNNTTVVAGKAGILEASRSADRECGADEAD